MVEVVISMSGVNKLTLLGPQDQNLRMVRQALGVDLRTDGDNIRIRGEEPGVSQARDVVERLRDVAQSLKRVGPEDVEVALQGAQAGEHSAGLPAIEVYATRRKIVPLTAGQRQLIESIRDHEITFAIGPAGTGKTYLSVAMAVQALKREQVNKIVLVRPAVEAGERLGFLPGDIQAKINPYLRPLRDALGEMMDHDTIKRFTALDAIEMIPLAYMRGRTLNEAFIILDEAQNTTAAQMKMFLTRMGRGSRIVVSGDSTQVDLPGSVRSGLLDAAQRLRHIREIAHVRLTGRDVVRHRLVQRIVDAYESSENGTMPEDSSMAAGESGIEHDYAETEVLPPG
jgi:phosphate starvation-inducible PhoH-like protein